MTRADGLGLTCSMSFFIDNPPLRDARPSLDGAVHGNELVFAQRTQVLKRPFDWVLHQTSPPQPELLEVASGPFAVGSEVRGDLRLGIILVRDQTIQRDEFYRLGDRLLSMLQAARKVPGDVGSLP